MDMDSGHAGRLSRRELLRNLAAAGVSSFSPFPSRVPGSGRLPGNPVREENAKPGTTDWMLQKTRVDPKTKYRCPWIEGYCSRTSLRAGETLEIMVSTNPASRFVIDLYRLGYYGGKGGRHLGRWGPFPGIPQPDPEVGKERLRECRWEPATRLVIPPEWLSGVYVGKLTAEKEGLESYIIFIVRDDRPCDFLFQSSDTTWAAYNRWPDHYALYNDGKQDWYQGRGVQVGWDRPYGKYCQILDAPLSQGSGEFFLWEFPLAFWMEREGYDVSYISNMDTHVDGKGLLRSKGWISVGHDEYWSLDMFRNVREAVAQGVSAAFLSGDTCWGVLSVRPNAANSPHRVISRIGQFGPIEERSARAYPEYRDLGQGGPSESTLIGARNLFPYVGGADWVCANAKHWIFQGTGMKEGDGIPGLVGWEWMGAPADIPGLEVLAKGKITQKEVTEEYTATLYPGPKENIIFNAATCWWADGLSEPPGYLHPACYGARPKGPDPRVQRITANLFNRMLGKS